jgi:hypothetical protein
VSAGVAVATAGPRRERSGKARTAGEVARVGPGGPPKAIHDLSDQLTRQMGMIGDDGTSGTAYKLLRGLVERHVRAEPDATPKGFQFMLARSGGYDGSEEPDYIYLSKFEEL